MERGERGGGGGRGSLASPSPAGRSTHCRFRAGSSRLGPGTQDSGGVCSRARPARTAPSCHPTGHPQSHRTAAGDGLRCRPSAWGRGRRGRGYLGAGQWDQGGLWALRPPVRSSSVLLAGASLAPAPAPRFLIFRSRLLTLQQPRRVQGGEVAKKPLNLLVLLTATQEFAIELRKKRGKNRRGHRRRASPGCRSPGWVCPVASPREPQAERLQCCLRCHPCLQTPRGPKAVPCHSRGRSTQGSLTLRVPRADAGQAPASRSRIRAAHGVPPAPTAGPHHDGDARMVMAKPGDTKDACVTPHAAGTVPGPDPPPSSPLCKAALPHVPFPPMLAVPPSHEGHPTAAHPGASGADQDSPRPGEAPPAGPASRCRATPPATRLAPTRGLSLRHSPRLGKATPGVIYAMAAYPQCQGSGNAGTQREEGWSPSSSSAHGGVQHRGWQPGKGAVGQGPTRGIRTGFLTRRVAKP